MRLTIKQRLVLARASQGASVYLCEGMAPVVLPMVAAGLMELYSEEPESGEWQTEVTFLGEVVGRDSSMVVAGQYGNESFN
jgi:hypothetical protein